MARILYNDEWFEEIASHGYYEAEFEAILQDEAARLFDSYRLIPFKTPVTSDVDVDTRKPDFALVHKAYRSWWVVEVELGHHSLGSHVLPQVRTLARARYGSPEADYLCRQDPSLRRDKVLEMLKGDQPRVLVIVNSPTDGWAEALHPLGARVVICQIFRSRLNRHLLRLNGDYPTECEEVITSCECQKLLHRMMAIHSPADLPVEHNETILLYHEGTASAWERIDTAGAVFLHALRDHDLVPGRLYEIVRQGDGSLAVRRSTSGGNN
jgi:hypothetical protein